MFVSVNRIVEPVSVAVPLTTRLAGAAGAAVLLVVVELVFEFATVVADAVGAVVAVPGPVVGRLGVIGRLVVIGRFAVIGRLVVIGRGIGSGSGSGGAIVTIGVVSIEKTVSTVVLADVVAGIVVLGREGATVV